MLSFSNRKMILEKNLVCGSVKADEMTKVKRPYFKVLLALVCKPILVWLRIQHFIFTVSRLKVNSEHNNETDKGV